MKKGENKKDTCEDLTDMTVISWLYMFDEDHRATLSLVVNNHLLYLNT